MGANDENPELINSKTQRAAAAGNETGTSQVRCAAPLLDKTWQFSLQLQAFLSPSHRAPIASPPIMYRFLLRAQKSYL